jgi:hypothetical protein
MAASQTDIAPFRSKREHCNHPPILNASKAHMPSARAPEAIIRTALFLILSSLPLAAQNSQPEALSAVRAAVASEMQASQTDHSIWTYRDHDDVPGKDATYLTIETRDGSLRRMVQLNGQPLTPAATEAESQRLDHYVHDKSAQAKARKNAAHDDAKAAEMLKMLPDAFIWSTVSQTAQLITLSFKPDPRFDPPNMEARVMGIMGGQMIIARNGNRIRTLRGALTQDVLFGFGIFAKLYKGGTFDVERREIGGGHWQITETHVHIGGHAMLFKSIGQEEDEVKTGWKPSSEDTLEGAARALNVKP